MAYSDFLGHLERLVEREVRKRLRAQSARVEEVYLGIVQYYLEQIAERLVDEHFAQVDSDEDSSRR